MTGYAEQKLLVANRGEIAVRIIHTAKKLGLPTIAVYTPSDALSLHVSLADEAVPLLLNEPGGTGQESEAKAYLSASTLAAICKAHAITLVHPGYGFLSENAEFASLLSHAGITWLGPRVDVIRTMGIKHEARKVAVNAGLEVVPGSDGLLQNEEEAAKVAKHIGFPVILKATAGGGGMGMVVCNADADLKKNFAGTKGRAKALFGDDGIFMERYFPAARHIEVQVFGNGLGDVVHMAERECSVQRRHQKVIEETPSPFFTSHPGLREKMCEAAVDLCRTLKYGSAGTVEFLVDDETGNFYFLEMNTRIQVEHPITEVIHPGLDIVKLMIQQGLAERNGTGGLNSSSKEMAQATYDHLRANLGSMYAIEGRVYAENPSEGFIPCPGLLQHVQLSEKKHDWLRIDSWITTGITITPYFDPLLCKIIVTGSSREEALSRFRKALEKCRVFGPPNNISYLKAITENSVFCEGRATTRFLDTFSYIPRAMKVISAGIDTSIQDLPGRTTGLGIPRSGPMDSLAFSAGNILVGNSPTTEGLEIVLVPGVSFSLHFFFETAVAVTGKDVLVKVDGKTADMWSRVLIPAGGKLLLEAKPPNERVNGFRVYLSVKGGFPEVPKYLGSKSTSMGFGGYLGRSLLPGDQISLGECSPNSDERHHHYALSKALVPAYPSHWIVYVLSGPHDDEEFVTSQGISAFYSTHWRVSASSNRLGIRLESETKIQWARNDGGEGGSHPSNILDNGYAPGSININGDTPVILTNEGPDMGGYICLCTVATADMWKLGQVSPGNTVEFRQLQWHEAIHLKDRNDQWLSAVQNADARATAPHEAMNLCNSHLKGTHHSPLLYVKQEVIVEDEIRVAFRQAGDTGILIEFGTMHLNLFTRARIHGFQELLRTRNISGIMSLCPCIRSILCFYNPFVISQKDALRELVDAEKAVPYSIAEMEFPGRKITFPIVLDDSWNRHALERYMHVIRDKAVYLPSNIEYLANNNGLTGGAEEALQKLVASDWLVLGVGFYLACPFLVPVLTPSYEIDPRCRLVGQKMNPSRTYTPRGAIGIAGPVAAIYPVESPGGYQLYGRTLPAWQTWGNGKDFSRDRPWLLQPFDQINFEIIQESEYANLEKKFDAGQYYFKIEPAVFSMREHSMFLTNIAEDLAVFRKRQEEGAVRESEKERKLLHVWESERKLSHDSSAQDELQDISEAGETITASLFASVWKIECRLGDCINSPDDVLIILEAMKTEIPVKAGERNVGKTVQGFGRGIKEQAIVRPGDVLIALS